MSQNMPGFPFSGTKSTLPLYTIPLRWVTDLSNIFLFQTRDSTGLVKILTRPVESLVYGPSYLRRALHC